MGWPVHMFQTEPDPNLLCPICQDVIDDAASFRCGHAFCRSCLSGCVVPLSCPSCRLTMNPGEVLSSVAIVNGIVGNSSIRCKHQCDREESAGGRNGTSYTKKNAAAGQCHWTGKLSRHGSHMETCPLEMAVCNGCSVEYPRGGMMFGYCGNCGRSENVVPAMQRIWCHLSLPDLIPRLFSQGCGSPLIEKKPNGMHSIEPGAECCTSMASSNGLVRSKFEQKVIGIHTGSIEPATAGCTSMASSNALVKSKFEQKVLGNKSGNCFHPASTTTKKGMGDTELDSDLIKDLTSKWKDMDIDLGDERSAIFVMNAVKTLVNAEVTKVKDHLAHPPVAHEKKRPEVVRQNIDSSVDTIRDMFVRCHILNFCQKWLERKPDALHDFIVYRHRSLPGGQHQQQRGGTNPFNNQLLCGIPGPKRSAWEGGIYPVLLDWVDMDVDSPPLCKFPQEFHHANVLPSGAVVLSTLRSDWHPETTIPEILFGLQQLLAHPNHEAPAQSAAYDSHQDGRYDFKTKIQASMYAPPSFLEMATDIRGSGDASSWCLVDDASLSCRPKDPRPSAGRPEEPEFFRSPVVGNNGIDRAGGGGLRLEERVKCKWNCSCCAWGQTLWDSRNEMRFLFGTGGGAADASRLTYH